MANHIIECATVGAIWQNALILWDQFAMHGFASFAWAYTATSGYRAWTITVDLVGGGTDTYVLIGLDCETSARPPLPYIGNAPGFRSPPPRAYPSVLWNGSNAKGQYGSDMWPFRKDLWNKYGGSSSSGDDEDQTTGSYGCDTHVWFTHYKRSDGMLVLDATGITWGTVDATVTYSYPTDFVSASTPAPLVLSGGGGSIDLTPLVDAVNEIANKDVQIDINQGAVVVSAVSAVEV